MHNDNDKPVSKNYDVIDSNSDNDNVTPVIVYETNIMFYISLLEETFSSDDKYILKKNGDVFRMTTDTKKWFDDGDRVL